MRSTISTRASLPALACLAVMACARQPAATFEVVQAPPPHIESIAHGAPGGAHPGDTVSLTMKGDPGLKASATLGSLAASIPLAEDASQAGLYRGSFRVPEGKTGTFDLTGRLSADTSLTTTLPGPALLVSVLPPPPPDLTKRTLTAADYNAQRALGPVHFEFDKSALSEEARRILTAHAEWLQGHPSLKVTVEGNCDDRGTNEYNLALGDLRANTIRDYLVAAGVAVARIRVVSFGEERPVDPGNSEESRAKNRRGEFTLED